MGGWASNSKYPFLGSLRSAAQMISYEVSIGLDYYWGDYFDRIHEFWRIVAAQRWRLWASLAGIGSASSNGVFVFYQLPWQKPIARLSICRRQNRNLVAGYQVEYSRRRSCCFMAGEYIAIFLMCALISLLFFGGWAVTSPGIP